MKILILCTGNTCRSQMAHGFLKTMAAGLDIQSAGTEPGGQVNPNAVKAMAELGIDISMHHPKPVNDFITDEWDYVITVCGGANETCPAFTGKVKQRLHIGFDDPSDARGTQEFITGEYRRVRDEIREAFEKFYEENLKN
jgi:arsenate reductase